MDNETSQDLITEISAIADRLRAAHDREMNDVAREIECLKDRLNVRGNSVVMRQALVSVRDAIYCDASGHRCIATDVDIEKIVNEALAAPQRNCDKYATAEEAWNAFDEWDESLRAKGMTRPLNEWGWAFAQM